MSNDGNTPLPTNPDGDPEPTGAGEQQVPGIPTPPAADPWGQPSAPQPQPQQQPQQPGTAYDGWGATGSHAQPEQPQQGDQQPTQQFGAQPYGGQPYESQQPTQQFGAQPYGGQPHESQQPTQQYGAQPYGGQQYGGQPGYGAAAGQPPYGPGGPQGPGGPGAPGGPNKKRVALIVGIAVAVVAIIALVIFLVTRPSDDSAQDPTTDPTESSETESSESPTETESPADDLAPEAVVEGYLTALSEGDAAAALSFIDAPSAVNATLLTDEVLAASNEIAPITDVVVTAPTEDNPYGVDVDASFSLGGTPTSATFNVSGDGDGGYSLLSPGGRVSLPSSVSGLEVTVNGVVVEPDITYDAFIGNYRLATTSPTFTIAGTVDAAIAGPYESAFFSGLEVDLTEEATQTFHEAVRAAVDGCLTSGTLDTGCGLAIPATLSDGTVITEGSVTRTLSGDAELRIGALNPSPNYDNPYFVRGDYIGAVTTSAECTQDGQVGTCEVLFGPSLSAPTVDFSTEPMTVVWN